MDNELFAIFLAEARRYIFTLTDISSGRGEHLRAAHNLKGAAGSIGEAPLSEWAMRLEKAIEHGERPGQETFLRRIVTTVEAMEVCHTPCALDLPPEDMRSIREVFVAEAAEELDAMTAALTEPDSPNVLDALFRHVHTLKSAGSAGFGTVGHAAHRLEDHLEVLRRRDDAISKGRVAQEVRRTLASVVDSFRTLVEIDVGTSDTQRALAETLFRIDELGAAPLPPLAPVDLEDRRENTPPKRRQEDRARLRIAPEHVDELFDGVGEVVIARTRIERRALELRALIRDLQVSKAALRARGGVSSAPIRDLDSELGEALRNLERLATLLHDDAASLRKSSQHMQEHLQKMRMVPAGTLFGHLARIARETARSEGKVIDFQISGDEVELDRTTSERISPGLVQLVRNAVAHGIEDSARRQILGKSAEGHVLVRAWHERDLLCLEVADDGAGIDFDRIRQKLITSGRLTPENAALCSPNELFDFLFEPGFSTRSSPDRAAGRGVGLDVLRDRIARLGGSVTVSSDPGSGTRFTIGVPLVSLIAQALLFKIGGYVYGIPSVHVERSAEAGEFVLHADSSHGAIGTVEFADTDGSFPRFDLEAALGAPTRPGGRPCAIVLRFGEHRFAVTCDKIIGLKEIVLKPLPALVAHCRMFAGATISGAGKVQLILDVPTLAMLRKTKGPLGREFPGADAVKRRRILLADDSRTVRESVSRMLASQGYWVDLVSDGLEAWERLSERHYDLCVTDIEMPRMNGIELIERIRGESRLESLPMLVISSRSASMVRERLPESIQYLKKPVLRRQLLACVETLLEHRGRMGSECSR